MPEPYRPATISARMLVQPPHSAYPRLWPAIVPGDRGRPWPSVRTTLAKPFRPSHNPRRTEFKNPPDDQGKPAHRLARLLDRVQQIRAGHDAARFRAAHISRRRGADPRGALGKPAHAG